MILQTYKKEFAKSGILKKYAKRRVVITSWMQEAVPRERRLLQSSEVEMRA